MFWIHFGYTIILRTSFMEGPLARQRNIRGIITRVLKREIIVLCQSVVEVQIERIIYIWESWIQNCKTEAPAQNSGWGHWL